MTEQNVTTPRGRFDGRPLLFECPIKLKEKIKEYFVQMDAQNRRYTLAGLAVHLDCSRATLHNYRVGMGKDFFDAIQYGKDKIEAQLEESVVNKETYCKGQEFALRNNCGWHESRDINLGGQEENPLKTESNVKLSPADAYTELLGKNG